MALTQSCYVTSGAARQSAALATPQICLQKFKYVSRIFKDL